MADDVAAEYRRRRRDELANQQRYLKIQQLRNREAELNAQLRDVREKIQRELSNQ